MLPYSWLAIFEAEIFAQAAKSEFSKILMLKNLYFEAQVDEKSVSQITCLCLPRIYLLIRMAYEGILTIAIISWQSLISGNPALISGNLDGKKRHYDGPG